MAGNQDIFTHLLDILDDHCRIVVGIQACSPQRLCFRSKRIRDKPGGLFGAEFATVENMAQMNTHILHMQGQDSNFTRTLFRQWTLGITIFGYRCTVLQDV